MLHLYNVHNETSLLDGEVNVLDDILTMDDDFDDEKDDKKEQHSGMLSFVSYHIQGKL